MAAEHEWDGKVDGDTVRPGQLVCSSGDLIGVVDNSDHEWWQGYLAADPTGAHVLGWFPVAYVKETKRRPTAAPAAVLPAAAAPPPPAPAAPKLDVPSKAERNAAFDRMDMNGNGGLSLAEIDKAIVETFPQFNHKPALIRAYKAADRDNSGFITRREFAKLLHFLGYFNDLWGMFEEIDKDHDRRLSFEEFKNASALVGHPMSEEEASSEFIRMDEDGGGVVLFDEFCVWCAHRHIGDGFEDEDEAVVDKSAHYQVPGGGLARRKKKTLKKKKARPSP